MATGPKTHKALAKRYRISPTGKVLRMKGGRSHLRRKKAKRTKRLFGEPQPVAPGMARRIRRALPHA
ncbi:MAG: 50S ribosomal protein L35 [Chloroflexota bacterium]